MRIGFILTTYNRIDDFLAHLDILKYFPEKHEVIPIWMNKNVPNYFLNEISNYRHAHYCNGINFSLGPLLGLISGIRKAHKIGLDYVIYRNGDDWLFNNNFVADNFKNTKEFSGYNWFASNYKKEFALNEMCLKVSCFIKDIDWIEEYFKQSNDKFLCEFKITKWIRKATTQFYRLPDRETYYGIGSDLDEFIKRELFKPDDVFLKTYKEENNRYFNKKWQLIGSHDNNERKEYYNILHIPYKEQLEKEPHFSRWLDGEGWNLPMNIYENFEDKSKTQMPAVKLIVPKKKI